MPEFYEKGLYAKYISYYLEYFPHENIYIALYEDLQADPVAFIQNIYNFLGVDKNYVPRMALQKQNVSKGVRVKFPLLEKIRCAVRYMLLRHVWIKSLLVKIKARRIKRWMKLKNSETYEMPAKPEMDTETREWLRQKYEDDIKELEAIIGKDLSHWE